MGAIYKPKPPERGANTYHNVAVDFGYTLLAACLIFYFGGRWLDGWLGTAPYLSIAGIILALAVGFNSLFRGLARVEKRGKGEPPKP